MKYLISIIFLSIVCLSCNDSPLPTQQEAEQPSEFEPNEEPKPPTDTWDRVVGGNDHWVGTYRGLGNMNLLISDELKMKDSTAVLKKMNP